MQCQVKNLYKSSAHHESQKVNQNEDKRKAMQRIKKIHLKEKKNSNTLAQGWRNKERSSIQFLQPPFTFSTKIKKKKYEKKKERRNEIRNRAKCKSVT